MNEVIYLIRFEGKERRPMMLASMVTSRSAVWSQAEAIMENLGYEIAEIWDAASLVCISKIEPKTK